MRDLNAVETARQDDVRKQQIDRLAAAQYFERLVPAARHPRAIAEPGKVRNSGVQNVGIVLDDEHDFPIGVCFDEFLCRPSGHDDIVGVRKIEANRRTPAESTLYRDGAARLAGEAVNLRKAEPGTPSRLL